MLPGSVILNQPLHTMGHNQFRTRFFGASHLRVCVVWVCLRLCVCVCVCVCLFLTVYGSERQNLFWPRRTKNCSKHESRAGVNYFVPHALMLHRGVRCIVTSKVATSDWPTDDAFFSPSCSFAQKSGGRWTSRYGTTLRSNCRLSPRPETCRSRKDDNSVSRGYGDTRGFEEGVGCSGRGGSGWSSYR